MGIKIKQGMGGSRCGKSRREPTAVLKKDSKKRRRREGKSESKGSGMEGLKAYIRETNLSPDTLIEVDGDVVKAADILSPNPFKDVTIVASYTDDDAIRDGTLFEPYPKRWPGLLISVEVKAACSNQQNRTFNQCLVPLLNDCIAKVQRKVKLARARLEEPKIPIQLHGTVAGTVLCYPNQKGGFTVLCPGEQ